MKVPLKNIFLLYNFKKLIKNVKILITYYHTFMPLLIDLNIYQHEATSKPHLPTFFKTVNQHKEFS